MKAKHLFREHVEDGFPRPLTEREDAVLSFLLSVETPGVDALRLQAGAAVAAGRCACGCATISLAVDRDAAPRWPVAGSPVIEADGKALDGAGLLLFADGGWLSAIELLFVGDDPPTEFPPADAFDRPRMVEPIPGPHTKVLAYFRGESEYVARCTSCERERADRAGGESGSVTFVARLPLDVESASLTCDHGHPYLAVRVDAEPPDVEPVDFRVI